MADTKTRLESVVTLVQVISVVAGVVISVLSFNSTRQKEAEARIVEATKPLYELRRAIYIETVKTAAIIANPDDRTPREVARAKRRFRELYVAELSMVEAPGVEQKMVAFAQQVDPSLVQLTPAQSAALNLSHALRDSYISLPSGR
ncbi:hypothetical protein [Pseudomonas fluorescens]|uniref:Uncharacterized protein n=1 Tax=Pseudomonas fluorescens TaxID=294 RepID=A0A5E7ANM1_PSEFL|nr:hypothetical protein [Pseudomonas fluorescens]VVN80666.1 hypothetical protein PS723_01062 [Pseudomonas fluorescens]